MKETTLRAFYVFIAIRGSMNALATPCAGWSDRNDGAEYLNKSFFFYYHMALVDIINSFLQGRDDSRQLLDSLKTEQHGDFPLPSYSKSSPISVDNREQDYSLLNDAGYWAGFFSRPSAVVEMGKFFAGQHFLGGVGFDLECIADDIGKTENASPVQNQTHNNYLFAGKINPQYDEKYVKKFVNNVITLQDLAKECFLIEYDLVEQISGKGKNLCGYFYVKSPSQDKAIDYIRKDLGLDHLFTEFFYGVQV